MKLENEEEKIRCHTILEKQFPKLYEFMLNNKNIFNFFNLNNNTIVKPSKS